jgi:hypothetical protein
MGATGRARQGKRPGLTTPEREEFRRLQREVIELKRAKEILKKAAAFFAQAEPDRRAKCDGALHRSAPPPRPARRGASYAASSTLTRSITLQRAEMERDEGASQAQRPCGQSATHASGIPCYLCLSRTALVRELRSASRRAHVAGKRSCPP